MRTNEVLNAAFFGEHYRATGSVEVFDEVEFDSVSRKSTVVKPNAGIKLDVMIWNPILDSIKRKNLTVKIKSETYAKNINQIADKLSSMPLIMFTDLRIGDFKGNLWASASSFQVVQTKGL